jgi:hypothetical protein
LGTAVFRIAAARAAPEDDTLCTATHRRPRLSQLIRYKKYEPIVLIRQTDNWLALIFFARVLMYANYMV